MNAEQTNPTNPSTGHDERGRFTVGNIGGPGNPFARQVAALRQALVNSVTAEDMHEIARKLIDLAKTGNVQAAKLVFSYTLGKPQPVPNPDQLDIDEWNGYRETAAMKEEAAPMMKAGSPEFHLHCVRTARPVIGQLSRQQVVDMCREAVATYQTDEEAAAEAERMMNTPFPVPPGPQVSDPSTNGDIGEPDPSANGGKRTAPAVDDRFNPSTNGKLHAASA